MYKVGRTFEFITFLMSSQRYGFKSYSVPYLFLRLSFLFCFLVLLFSINIYLKNCYLIKCNKKQEKYRVSRKKIVCCILNIWINNLNFYHFLKFTVEPELITIWSFSKQRSHDFLWKTDGNYYFLTCKLRHSRSFRILLSLTNVSLNRMCHSITIF